MSVSITFEDEANKIIDRHYGLTGGENTTKNIIARQHYTTISESLIPLNLVTTNTTEVNPYVVESNYQEYRTIDLFAGHPDPTNYCVSVTRGTFVTESIPLFIYDEDDNGMEVVLTCTIGGTDYTSSTPITYIDTYNTINRNKYVYNVAQWLKIVNTATKLCYDGLITNTGLSPVAFVAAGGPPTPPIFVYGYQNTFYWKMAKQYETETTPVNNLLNIKFWFNQVFNTKLQNGFNVVCDNFNPNPTYISQWYYSLVVEDDNFGNYKVVPAGTDYYMIRQLHDIYDNLIQAKKIIITTNMGIDSEFTNNFYKFVDKDGNVQSQQNDGPNPSSTTPVRILMDINIDPNLDNFQSILTYQPEVPRYYNINTNTFRIIQFAYYWSGTDGKLHPLYLPFNSACSIKLLATLR
jgi:hypothetical protein